jgi:hypothetical protein
MIKLLKRTTDNKYLQSFENDIWVDTKKDAFEMTYRECETTKSELLKTYQTEQIVEIVDMFKNKPVSIEEKQELISLLRK